MTHNCRVVVVEFLEKIAHLSSLHRNISPNKSPQTADGIDGISPVQLSGV